MQLKSKAPASVAAQHVSVARLQYERRLLPPPQRNVATNASGAPASTGGAASGSGVGVGEP
jgi:hypothetical protein